MKYLNGFGIRFTYYIYIHKYAPCHFVSSKKECVVAYTFLQDIFVLRLVPNLSSAHNGK